MKKKSSRGVNVHFQCQADNSETKHFFHNFKTKNVGDILNFWLKLEDGNNKNVEFEDGGKKYPVINFLTEFLAWTEK